MNSCQNARKSCPKNSTVVFSCRENTTSYARLSNCISQYQKKYLKRQIDEIKWFSSLTLDDAIKYAALSINSGGKRFSHQFRIPMHALQDAYNCLRRSKSMLIGSIDFEQLHLNVKKSTHNIHGIGPLYIYDTSFRLGSHLGLLPKNVYLHAGTREGARALGINCYRKTSLALIDLPSIFSDLDPYQIEDILCIYKSHFIKIVLRIKP